jgi:plastocyanin
LQFSPRTVTILVGTYVTWKNSGAVAHTSTADANAWNSGNVGVGGTFQHFFNTPGTSYTYHCAIHPTMTATVVVAP